MGPKVMLAAGIVSVLAGIIVLLASIAPMFVGPPTTIGPSMVGPFVDSVPMGTTSQSAATNGGLGHNVMTDGPVDGIAFQMSIPALGYRATVLEGVDTAQLDRGPGHYPDSAWPGQPGNVAIAAHNVYWISFARLHVGDEVRLQTRHGTFTYKITGSEVVAADNTSVLAQTPDHRLTLTTCYPLWAGAFATKRLVFFAEEV